MFEVFDDAKYVELATSTSIELWITKLLGGLNSIFDLLTYLLFMVILLLSLKHFENARICWNISKHIDIASKFILDRTFSVGFIFKYVSLRMLFTFSLRLYELPYSLS